MFFFFFSEGWGFEASKPFLEGYFCIHGRSSSFVFLSFISVYFLSGGWASEILHHFGMVEINPNKNMGCGPSTGDSDFAGPSTQDGAPQLCLLV